MVTYGTSAFRKDDNKNATNNPNRWDGCVFNPNQNLVGVEVAISSQTYGVNEIAIFDSNNNKLISNANSNNWDSRKKVSVYDPNVTLSSGTDYWVLGIQDSSSYQRGILGGLPYPYTSSDVDVIAGAFGKGDRSGGNWPMWDSVRAIYEDSLGITIDGTAVSAVTIDGTAVQEVTIDGNVVLSGGLGYDSFEDGDTSGWTVQSGSVTTNYASNQTHSFDNDADVSRYAINRSINGKKPSEIGFSYRETSSSGGIAYIVKDTNGNPIFASGTGNPQIQTEHGNGTWYPADGQYDTWNRYTIKFDWSNSTFDIRWKNLSNGTTHTTTGKPFMNTGGGGIGRIGCGNWNFVNRASANPKGYEWVDDIWGI